uniref:Uncharacterized protein n=1 Tax=Arundo donax TaxID=35708 RepID=A0A0A9A8Q6_ARUDO
MPSLVSYHALRMALRMTHVTAWNCLVSRAILCFIFYELISLSIIRFYDLSTDEIIHFPSCSYLIKHRTITIGSQDP